MCECRSELCVCKCFLVNESNGAGGINAWNASVFFVNPPEYQGYQNSFVLLPFFWFTPERWTTGAPFKIVVNLEVKRMLTYCALVMCCSNEGADQSAFDSWTYFSD